GPVGPMLQQFKAAGAGWVPQRNKFGRTEQMRIWSLDRLISPVVVAFILALGLMGTPAWAQSTTASDPAAQAVSEQQLLDELGKIQGRITIPDQKAATLQQPQGRDYQTFQR